MPVYVLPTHFTAKDGISPVVKGISHNLAMMTERANVSIAKQERLFRRLAPSIGNAGKQLLNYATAGAGIALAGFSVKSIMDYETAIQSLSAVTGVTGDSLADMKKEVESVAAKTQKSAIDVAGSFEVIGSAMSQYLTDPAALRSISEAGIVLAKASRMELVPTLENLTGIMNQFNLKAEDANDVINRLSAGEIVGSLRTAQVAESLQHFGANAATANVSLAESVALVEALAKQRPVANLGIDARNILIVLDAAKALDKKAKKHLRAAGVDMNLLADKTKSLSARLHELSKIEKDNIGMVRIFGERNITTAKVIFNQLKTYDEFAAKIAVTNEAQHQAAVNSNTLAQSVDRLKNKWVNYISTGDHAGEGLKKLQAVIGYVTNNMDTLISVGVNVLGFFAAWKAVIIAQKVVTMGLTAAMAVQSAVGGALFLVDMVKYVAVTQGMTKATAAWSIAQSSLNAAIAANPIGLMVIAAAALAGGIYLINQREKELIELYQKKIQLNMSAQINQETSAVRKLIAEYWNLGLGIKDATAKAINFRLASIDYQRNKAEERIANTKAEINKVNAQGMMVMLPSLALKKQRLQEQLAAQQESAANLSAQRVGELQFAQSQVAQGTISAGDVKTGMGSKPEKKQETFGGYGIDYNRLESIFTRAIKNSQIVDVKISGAPNGTTVKSSANMPSTNSQ